jgi:LacI family transcriptional regulator
VLIGSSAERFPDTPSIGSDIAQAVRLGMDHLVSLGHPTPALILGPKSRLARARFLRSVHEHCLERDVDPAILLTEDSDYTFEGGYAAMQRLMVRRPVGHLAVFCANDLIALGAMLAAREAGRECPRDVSILGFDGVPAGAFSWPGLTTIEKPAREMGRRAAQALFAEIAGRPQDGRTYLPCRLIERGSLADLTVQTPLRVAGAGRN